MSKPFSFKNKYQKPVKNDQDLKNLSNLKNLANAPHVKEEKEEGQSEVKTFGYAAKLTFGKYKGLTYYDVANEGDFKYLIWLLQVNKHPGFVMHPSAVPHIETALLTKDYWKKNQSTAMWQEHTSTEQNGKKTYLKCYWSTQLYPHAELTESPMIHKMMCNSCNCCKNLELMDEEKSICQRCLNL